MWAIIIIIAKADRSVTKAASKINLFLEQASMEGRGGWRVEEVEMLMGWR